MANIRILRTEIIDSNTLKIIFTNNLNTSINITNININSLTGSIPNPEIISVNISENAMIIKVRCFIDNAYYQAILASSDTQIFCGAKGENFIEDGATNYIYFIGPKEENEIRENIFNDITDIYNKEKGSLIFDAINGSSHEILNASHKIQEIGSANYISVEVTNEEIVRGKGAFDRFSNEGVYEVLRVSKNQANFIEDGDIAVENFPIDPISLQQIFTSETVSNTVDSFNSFSSLIINLSNKNIIKVISIILTHDNEQYEYNILKYKYGILNSKYDSKYAYDALDLLNNQIKLNNNAIGPTFPLPTATDTIYVSYYYRNIGRDVDLSSLEIAKSLQITRESIPAVSTSFFLKNAPIIDNNGNIANLNGITWLDPSQNYDPSKKHPSFLTEISYNNSSFLNGNGQYMVNYSTGQVFVFGTNGVDGTGFTPPVATYVTKYYYRNNLDYVFFSDLNEVISLPNGELRGNNCNITFKYEDTFSLGIDFNFNSHVEISNERVQNNLIGNNGIRTLYGPVNDVFRIYNETTGEIYTPTRIKNNEVYFSSIRPPNLINITREYAIFEQKNENQLIIADSYPGSGFTIYKILLSDEKIGSEFGNFIGANFNSSLKFSNSNMFLREFFYDESLTYLQNINKLEKENDYCVNYTLGIIYIASNNISNIGDISYKTSKIQTKNNNVTSVSDLYRSASVNSLNTKIFDVKNILNNIVEVNNIETLGEFEDVDGNPIVVSSNSVNTKYDIFKLMNIYQITDLKTTSDPINFAIGASISSSIPTTITFSNSGVEVIDNNDIEILLGTLHGFPRLYITANRISYLSSYGLVELISVISIIDNENGINYFTLNSDGEIDNINNRIYLPSSIVGVEGRKVTAKYKIKLLDGAAVVICYSRGDMYIDYTYCNDEILITYEYGDNVLDWSISNSLYEDEVYYVSYRYGALRNALRDNFGILTGLNELSIIKEGLERETYRDAVFGALQTFPKGPTIPSLKKLVESITKINPEITESVFLEWILGRDYLNLSKIEIKPNLDEFSIFSKGKFNNGLLLNKSEQSAILPLIGNLRINEGTWEAFVTPEWDGYDNDAELTFDIKIKIAYDITDAKIYIGSNAYIQEIVPFTINRFDPSNLGMPNNLFSETDFGYFIWYDSSLKKWRIRTKAPKPHMEGQPYYTFSGTITTTGEFNNVKSAKSIDGDGTSSINEINDSIRSTDSKISFSFKIDEEEESDFGYDGVDFCSDNLHYFFDTGLEQNRNRISIFKDGKGFVKFKIYDDNKKIKQLSANIKSWKAGENHHIAVSWKIGTIEMYDEMHLFIDGSEVPNTYKFKGYLNVPSGTLFMDDATEVLVSNVTNPTIGGSDLSTIENSNIVTSLNSFFLSESVQINNKFIILDDTNDGIRTRTYPYVYVKNILGENQLTLKDGNGNDFLLQTTLDNVIFSINPIKLPTVSNVFIEKIRVFSLDSLGNKIELYSPNTINPDYSLSQDGYQDYVTVYNGLSIGDSIILYSYGLTLARYRQYAYIWPNLKTNLLNTIMPPPISTSKINVTKIITKSTNIEPGTFALIATNVGGHAIAVFSSNLDFCQPSNEVTGKKISGTLYGTSNIDFTGINKLYIIGTTTDNEDFEEINFISSGTLSTTKNFTSIIEIVAFFTPKDITKSVGAIEIRETYPINWQENNGEYAKIYLSIKEQNGNSGTVEIGGNILTDPYAIFLEEDIGKIINITSPSAIAGTYTIEDVLTDSFGIKDSNSIVLNTTWIDSYDNIYWSLLNTSYGDSGFANGLITLEIAGSGGQPFLLGSCWYEVDFPTALTIPWTNSPENIYIGSDIFLKNQACCVIDEMRILDEISVDTGRGEVLPSSGRTISTDYISYDEFLPTPQTLCLFNFNNNLDNLANFYSSFDGTFRQSENSVNESFGQSAIFNLKKPYQIDNKAIFNNKSGTIEFWVSPILDTYNDPTKRYYIDLTPEKQINLTALSATTILLPYRARSVSVVTIALDITNKINYFIGGSLDDSGYEITLGQPLPKNIRDVVVTYVPITNQGDRFSIYKNSKGYLVFNITASGIDYQIQSLIYWKKNTWHRIFAGWDLNNPDNQDVMILLIDGIETGTIRYGTGLIYGTGILYGQKTIFGSAIAGTVSSRSLLSDINLLDKFNKINIGSDFTGQFTALARMDNIRFSNQLRQIKYLGGDGPGKLIGRDLLYTSNTNVAQPVISDALTSLLLDFNTTQTKVEYLAKIRDAGTGIFDFYVNVIDTFNFANTDLIHNLITSLINKLKPAHTRAFVDFIK